MRTDLDALEPRVFELLIAQGYFLTDFMAKLSMPDLVFEGLRSRAWYTPGLTPDWALAHEVVQVANANQRTVTVELMAAAQRRLPVGRVSPTSRRWVYRGNVALVSIPICAALMLTTGWLAYGAWVAGLVARAIGGAP